MLILGIETSCDETGLALYDSGRGLLAHALHSQVGDARGLWRRGAGARLARPYSPGRAAGGIAYCARPAPRLADLDGIAYTQGPGLAGALLVGASVANALAFALGMPALGVHHLEGHLLSPLLGEPRAGVPLRRAAGFRRPYAALRGATASASTRLLGETQDDAAGEAFDKTAKLLGLAYPGGPALAKLAEHGRAGAVALPRPMLDSGDLNISFSGLKTAVLTLVAARAARLRAAQGRYRARVRGRDRRRAGREIARRAATRPG